MRRLPTILHEHANLTDTPWFQKIADRLLEPYDRHRASPCRRAPPSSCIEARQMPPERVKVVYLGVPLEEFSRDAHRRRDRRGAARARHRAGRVRRRHRDAAARLEGQLVPRRGRAARRRRSGPKPRFFLVGEGPLRPALEAQARALGLGDRFVFAGFAARRRARRCRRSISACFRRSGKARR